MCRIWEGEGGLCAKARAKGAVLAGRAQARFSYNRTVRGIPASASADGNWVGRHSTQISHLGGIAEAAVPGRLGRVSEWVPTPAAEHGHHGWT